MGREWYRILSSVCESSSMRILAQSGRSLWRTWRIVGTAFLFAGLVIGLADFGKAQSLPPSASAISPRFAIADFDGDNQPDLATVEVGQVTASRARYWILFQMSAGPRQFIGVTAPVGGIEIASRDVNGDSSPDLVVTTPWLNRPVAVLLNDGHGNFTLYDPAAFSALVWSYETSLYPANVEIGVGDVAAVFTRLAGDCELNQGVLPAPDTPGRAISEVSHGLAFPPAVFVLGRAPPASLLHL
jgi:hypothetical protein